MKGSIRNRAVLFSILIILFSSVTVMIGAVAVSVRQINSANSEHLDRAMGSVHRQLTDELHRMRTVFKGSPKPR